jgi:mannose-6-phosphate isomerase-like protein (cupin superfamily)
MLTANLGKQHAWFEVLHTTDHTQTAIMTLAPGQASGETAEAHPKSDQVLVVLEGEVIGEIAGVTRRFEKEEVVLIPAGTKHRFVNESLLPVKTFSVYGPPAYPAGTKG